jgi:hypothetical protein
MIDDCLFGRCRGLSCVQGVGMIDDCWFCRCRGLSCVQGVRMIDDCLFVDVVVLLHIINKHLP